MKADKIRSFFKKQRAKDLLAVGLSNMAIRPILIIRGFIVAKYLGPADYGLLKSIEMIQMLDKFGSLGFNKTAKREAGDLIGKNEIEKAEKTRNVSYSLELILSLLLFSAGLCTSLFFEDAKTSIMIIMASSGMLASKVRGIFTTEASIQKKFILTSKITFATLLFASIVVILTVPFLKIYAVLLTNIVVGISASIFLYKYLHFRFRFNLDKAEVRRVFKISVPLTVGTLALGSFRYSERILVVTFLGPVALGFYSFAELVYNQILNIFKLSIKVRIQDIYEGLGSQHILRVHKMVVKETLILIIASLCSIPVAWFAIDYFIPLLLPQWNDAVLIAQIFLIVIPFQIIPLYVSNVLRSALVNKQAVLPVYQFIATALLIVGTLAFDSIGVLDLKNFILLNMACYSFFSFSMVFLYKVHFYNTFVKEVAH